MRRKSVVGGVRAVTKLLEQAVEKLQSLPPDVQDEAARVLLLYVGDDEPMVELTAEEEVSLRTSLDQATRGEFATDEQVRAIWAKHGL